jgi:hypothetical protein
MPDLFLRERLNVNLVLDDKVIASAAESVLGEVYWRWDDETDMEPQLLGTASAGRQIVAPFDFSSGRGIVLFLVSGSAEGNRSAYRVEEGRQLFFKPNIETLEPSIGQLSDATNTQVTIWVNNFTEKAKYRKIEVSTSAMMTSPTVVIQEASEFAQNLLPSEVLISKPVSVGTETKYIRVSHSSNGDAYGTASNVLSITFADNTDSGGDSGDGEHPCFIGSTGFKLDGGSKIPFEKLFDEREVYVGRYARSFDEFNKPVAGLIEEVFRHPVYEYLEVTFEDGAVSGVTREHPYKIETGDWRAVGKLKVGDYVFDDSDKPKLVKIAKIEKIEVPEGIYVYNARIARVQNYSADDRQVHNVKQVEL